VTRAIPRCLVLRIVPCCLPHEPGKLRQLYEVRGCLSGLIIDEIDHMPSSTAYASRFGSLVRAYHTKSW